MSSLEGGLSRGGDVAAIAACSFFESDRREQADAKRRSNCDSIAPLIPSIPL